ncbi:MAG: hypothetical protein R3E97_09480 [Candidatus Eisenbacteria bacterium]
MGMHQLVMEFAAVVALAVAALVGLVGVWQGATIYTIAFRIMISGGLVFFFALIGGHVLGRSILEDIAREEMERKEQEALEKARQEAAQGASPVGEGAMGAMAELLGAASTSSDTEGSSSQAA